MSANRHLLRALAAHFGPLADAEGEALPWSSATFAGTQHELAFTVERSPHVEALLGALADLDLPMPGQFVAGIELTDRSVHGGALRLGVRALTIAEA